MALDFLRNPKRYRVYIRPPAGGELLWDDCDTTDEARTLGESTFCEYRIHDRLERPGAFNLADSLRRLTDKVTP